MFCMRVEACPWPFLRLRTISLFSRRRADAKCDRMEKSNFLRTVFRKRVWPKDDPSRPSSLTSEAVCKNQTQREPTMNQLTVALLQLTSQGNDQDANEAKGERFCRRAQ